VTDQGPDPIREDPPEPLPGQVSPRRRKLAARESARQEQRPNLETDDDPRDRIHTPYDEEGPEETDPERRESMTMGEIEPSEGEVFPDTSGRGPPKNLTDICATYPLGDGSHYIRVERLKPTVFFNMPCAGVLGEIHEQMSEAEFRRKYGGGVYELIVYGPDPRGRTNPQTDEPIIKTLTKPVKLTVPGKPNPATITGRGDSRSDEVETGLFSQRRFRDGGLPPTSAEASMHRDGISFAQTLVTEERKKNDELEREQRARAEREARQVVEAVRETSGALQKRLEHEIETERAARREAEKKLEEQAKRPTDTQNAWGAMKDVAQALAPRGSSENELTRIYDSHRNEVNRLTDSHRIALDDARRTADERVKTFQDQLENERRRAAEHERDLRDSLERKEKDLREENDKRMREVNDRHEREMREMDQRRRDEVERLRADHERELKAAERQSDLLRQTDKTSLESRMATMKDRLELMKDELDRARSEAAEKPNLTEQLQEAETTAKLLGFEKKDDSAPRDWKERIAESVGTALQNLPEVIKAVGDNQTKKAQAQAQAERERDRAAQQQDKRLPQRQGPPPPGQAPQRRVIGGAGGPIPAQRHQQWATEDIGPAGYPSAPEGAQSVQAGAARGSVEPGARPPAAAAPAPAPAAAPAEPVPAHEAEPAEVEAAPQAQAAAAQQLEQLKVWVELEISRQADPSDFAKRLVDQVGADAAYQMTEKVKVDDILNALAGDPKSALSPILRREGQAFFRKAWSEANKYARTLLDSASHEEPPPEES
jgi:hypothetical protein